MALEVTPIYRNLRTRVTFFGLEAEDLFAILAVAVAMNICSGAAKVVLTQLFEALGRQASGKGAGGAGNSWFKKLLARFRRQS